jgi:hypothetical protein
LYRMVYVHIDKTFHEGNDPTKPVQGYAMDDNLHANLKNYLIPAVKNNWDSVIMVGGIEGCIYYRMTIRTPKGAIRIGDIETETLKVKGIRL